MIPQWDGGVKHKNFNEFLEISISLSGSEGQTNRPKITDKIFWRLSIKSNLRKKQILTTILAY